MTFGLSPQDWTTIENLAIFPLKNLGAKVYIFGSRARGNHREFSDLDILYVIKNKPPLHKIGEIKDLLNESNLPIKVDLVDFDEAAETYKENMLMERIEV